MIAEAPYDVWLERRIEARSVAYAGLREPIKFSLLTTVYHRTPNNFFRELIDNVFGQTYTNFEWIIVAQGPIHDETLEALRGIEAQSRVTVVWLEQNLGVIGGLRRCFREALGDYLIPLDSDDLLTPDALAVMQHHLAQAGYPAFAYSDEDHLIGGIPQVPFIRCEWDPVLALSTSYIWHLCAFRNDRAAELEVYSDNAMEWCQDWDSVMRFSTSGERIVHVPEVLYHWRQHAVSSTNRADPESGSLRSQRAVLERFTRDKSLQQLFSVEEFPIFRGATEFWLHRKKTQPAKTALLVYGTDRSKIIRLVSRAIQRQVYPFAAIFVSCSSVKAGDLTRIADLLSAADGGSPGRAVTVGRPRELPANDLLAFDSIVVCSERLQFEDDEWAWEADGLFRLHADAVVVAGRVLHQGRVLGGAEIFGFDGVLGTPDYDRRADDAGPFALALKARSVSAAYSEFYAVRGDFLASTLAQLGSATWEGLGMWLGALALRTGKRIAFDPLVCASIDSRSDVGRVTVDGSESAAFLSLYSDVVPDYRWYPRHLARARENAYQFSG